MEKFLDYLIGLIFLSGVIALFIWLMWRSLKSSDDPGRLIARWVLSLASLPIFYMGARSGIFGLMFCVVGGVFLGLLWAPSIGHALSRPLTDAIDGGLQQAENRPCYSIAESRRKLGKYGEAIAEIQLEMQKHPEDYAGQMMIAEIQAENLKDLAAARITVEALLQQKEHSQKNLAYALNRLADWHLKLENDSAGARKSLEWIGQLYPQSEEAYLASQRIAHLGNPAMEARRESRKVVLKHYEDNLGLREDFTGLKPPPEDHNATLQQYIKQLEACPTDNEIREQLATLYALKFQQLDLALDQIEQMIAQPGVPPRKVAHWLNLVAEWQIKVQNVQLARQALQRIIDLYPESTEAGKARQRMNYLLVELRGQKEGGTIKLGEYDQRLGLNQ